MQQRPLLEITQYNLQCRLHYSMTARSRPAMVRLRISTIRRERKPRSVLQLSRSSTTTFEEDDLRRPATVHLEHTALHTMRDGARSSSSFSFALATRWFFPTTNCTRLNHTILLNHTEQHGQRHDHTIK